MKRIHYISGLVITLFIIFHLINHVYSLFGIEEHILLMDKLRIVYRNPFAETLLVGAVFVQVVSGLKLFLKKRKTLLTLFDQLQIWSGVYLAIFFVFHLSAVFIGRLVLELDTNVYFGIAGLNTFPLNLFFIPYYSLAIISFFGHISAIHSKKMKHNIIGITPNTQSYLILISGILLTIIILYGLTGGFQGVPIPNEYDIVVGK